MASFFVLLTVSGSAVAVYPPNSGYPSAEAPSYFDLELQFLVAAATGLEIQVQKLFCIASYGASMSEGD